MRKVTLGALLASVGLVGCGVAPGAILKCIGEQNGFIEVGLEKDQESGSDAANVETTRKD